MTDLNQSYSEIIGGWLVREADEVCDMGRRVNGVLSQDPRDHHYARSKMAHALGCVVRALTYADCPEEQLLELVRTAREQALRNTDSLRREFARPEDSVGAAFEEAR
jgi:hypothetical protein